MSYTVWFHMSGADKDKDGSISVSGSPSRSHGIASPETASRLQAPSPSNGHLVSLVARESLEAEHYRRLRYAVEKNKSPDRGSVIAIASPAVGDGKTLTAINLAGSLAQDPATRVLLVDMDVRRPPGNLGSHLGLSGKTGPGLVELLNNRELPWERGIRHLKPFNLSIMPAGERRSTPYELLNSARFQELFAELRAHYDYIILDTPPVVLLPDCEIIARAVDGFLVVIAAHRTPRKLLGEALNVLPQEKVLGLVFNDSQPADLRHYGYDFSHTYNRPAAYADGMWARFRSKFSRINDPDACPPSGPSVH